MVQNPYPPKPGSQAAQKPPKPSVGDAAMASMGKPDLPDKFGGGPSAPSQSYKPTQAPFGYDKSQPGQLEQFWNQNQNMWMSSPQLDWVNQTLPQYNSPFFGENYNTQNMGQFGAPGQGQQYWNQVAGSFNSKGTMQGPNRAGQVFDQFQQNMPGSLQPQFDQAYDRARDKAVGSANQQAAARGVYGSSAALNNVGNVINDFEANRAKAATDFSLADSQNQMNWLNSASQSGRSGDISSSDFFNNNLRGISTFGDLAFNAENADLNRDQFTSNVAGDIDATKMSRLGQGAQTAMGIDDNYFDRLTGAYGAAGAADSARENRINTLFGQLSGFSDKVNDWFSDQYEGYLGSDDQILNNILNGQLGRATDAYNVSNYEKQDWSNDIQQVLDMISAGKQMGM